MARFLDHLRSPRVTPRSQPRRGVAFRPSAEGLEVRLSPSAAAPGACPAPPGGHLAAVPHIDRLKMAPA